MKEKIIPLKSAARIIQDGWLLGLTGPAMESPPMAFLRELIRRGVKNLKVAALPGGGLNIDLLIAAGAVAEVEACYCSLGEFGQAPHFQKALSLRKFKIKDNT